MWEGRLLGVLLELEKAPRRELRKTAHCLVPGYDLERAFGESVARAPQCCPPICMVIEITLNPLADQTGIRLDVDYFLKSVRNREPSRKTERTIPSWKVEI